MAQQVRFRVKDNHLMMAMGGNEQSVLKGNFAQQADQVRCADYLRMVAAKLNEIGQLNEELQTIAQEARSVVVEQEMALKTLSRTEAVFPQEI